MGRARLPVLFVGARRAGGRTALSGRQPDRPRPGAQPGARPLGGVRHGSAAPRRGLAWRWRRAGGARARLVSRPGPQDARRTGSPADAARHDLGRQRHLSGLADRRPPVLARSAIARSIDRRSRAWATARTNGPFQRDPPYAGRRRARLHGRGSPDPRVGHDLRHPPSTRHRAPPRGGSRRRHVVAHPRRHVGQRDSRPRRWRGSVSGAGDPDHGRAGAAGPGPSIRPSRIRRGPDAPCGPRSAARRHRALRGRIWRRRRARRRGARDPGGAVAVPLAAGRAHARLAVEETGSLRRRRCGAAGGQPVAASRAARGYPVPAGRHRRVGHARRRRLAGPRPPSAGRTGAMAAIRLRPARAADARDSGRADPRLRSQRHLAADRRERRWRSRRPRALLERLRADRGPARVPQHHPAGARRRVRHRQGRPGGGDHRQTQRQRAADLGGRPAGNRARLRTEAAESRRQRAHGPGHRQRSAGTLHPDHAAARRSRPAILRVHQHDAAGRILSGADRRSADVDSALGQCLGDVAGVALRRPPGAPQRFAGAHRLQPARAVPRAPQRSRPHAAGGGGQHHPRLRLPAAQRLGEPGRRPAVSRGVSDSRLGNHGDAPRRARTRATYRERLDAAARNRGDGQGRAAALRGRARRRQGRGSVPLCGGELALPPHPQVRLAAAQGGRHARRRSSAADERPRVPRPPQRLRRGARHDAGDADAGRLVARDSRRHPRSRRARRSRPTSCRPSIPAPKASAKSPSS